MYLKGIQKMIEQKITVITDHPFLIDIDDEPAEKPTNSTKHKPIHRHHSKNNHKNNNSSTSKPKNYRSFAKKQQ